MRITFGHDGCRREIPPAFKHRLEEFNRHRRHPVYLIWNPRAKTIVPHAWVKATGQFQRGEYEGRWEVWVGHDESRHPGRTRIRDKDRRLLPGGIEAIKLMDYEWSDGSYADPFNENFLRVMHLADSWTSESRHSGPQAQLNDLMLYEAMQDDALKKDMLAIASGTMEYYRRYDNPVVGPGSKGDWRWRLPHR